MRSAFTRMRSGESAGSVSVLWKWPSVHRDWSTSGTEVVGSPAMGSPRPGFEPTRNQISTAYPKGYVQPATVNAPDSLLASLNVRYSWRRMSVEHRGNVAPEAGGATSASAVKRRIAAAARARGLMPCRRLEFGSPVRARMMHRAPKGSHLLKTPLYPFFA